MNRRELLKVSTLTGGALAFPGLTAFGKNNALSEVIKHGHIEIKLADLGIMMFSDGHIRLDNPQPIFAPGVDPAEVKNALRKLYLDEDKLEGAINVLLIKKGQRKILIDTGSGYHLGEHGGRLLNNLKNAGIKNTDITDVFITHAHVDHIGGIIAKDKTLLYPKASYYIAKKEYEFWMSDDPDFSKSKSPQSQESVAFTQGVLQSIQNRLIFFEPGDVLFSCMRTELAEGHTPGHTIFTIFLGDKSIKHIVDVVHSSLLIAKPAWGTQWDVDFNKGVETRKDILKDCYDNRTLVMTTHLPWPGLGYIGKNGEDYQWVPFSYFIPDEIAI